MIDAKQSFLSQVRKRAAEELTAADMERLMVILSDTMEGFRVEELKADGWTANQEEICDELRVDMVDLPEDLVNLIEDALVD